jgi:hypothetical protein|nr:MAG TPA: hypothetical protein [Caudoviricetes sp.]
MNANQFNLVLNELKTLNIGKIKEWQALNLAVVSIMRRAGLEEDDVNFELEADSIKITQQLCLKNKVFLPTVKVVDKLQEIFADYASDGRLKMKGFKAPAEPSKQDLYNFLIDFVLDNNKANIATYTLEILGGLSGSDLEIPELTDFVSFTIDTYKALTNKQVSEDDILPFGFQYYNLAGFVYKYTKTIPTAENCEDFESDVKETANALHITMSDDLIDNINEFNGLLRNFGGFDTVRKLGYATANKTEFLDVLVDFIDFEGITEY